MLFSGRANASGLVHVRHKPAGPRAVRPDQPTAPRPAAARPRRGCEHRSRARWSRGVSARPPLPARRAVRRCPAPAGRAIRAASEPLGARTSIPRFLRGSWLPRTGRRSPGPAGVRCGSDRTPRRTGRIRGSMSAIMRSAISCWDRFPISSAIRPRLLMVDQRLVVARRALVDGADVIEHLGLIRKVADLAVDRQRRAGRRPAPPRSCPCSRWTLPMLWYRIASFCAPPISRNISSDPGRRRARPGDNRSTAASGRGC